MRFIDKQADPSTIWYRVPPIVYGILWSAAWLMAAILVMVLVGNPWTFIAGFSVSACSVVVTLWVTRA